MNVFFIHLPHIQKGGLPIIDNRNKYVLQNLYENINEVIYNPFTVENNISYLQKCINKLKLIFSFDIYTKVFRKYNAIVTNNEKNIYFFSHSYYGSTIKRLKKENNNTIIISFFHNVELDYQKQILRNNLSIRNLYRYWIIRNAEKQTIKYSDKILVLNKRDANLLKTIYKHNNAIIFPTSLKDRYIYSTKQINENKPLKLLFVGTLFPANEEGIMWFINNIFPFVNVHLDVVGMGMDKLSNRNDIPKDINIIGEVDAKELDDYYYNADIFVSTLFSGGGMKTKIAEAMMFGLPIIGTKESFQGYEFDHSLIGINSDCSQDIISFINDINIHREKLTYYSQNARQLFVERYSYDSSVDVLKNINY